MAARCLGAQIKHTQEPGKEVRSYVCMHGFHPVAQAKDGVQFELRSSMEWLEQRGGGLLLGDFNRVVCCKWRFGTGKKLTPGDRALRKAARWSCGCCAQDDDPDAEVRMVRGPDGA